MVIKISEAIPGFSNWLMTDARHSRRDGRYDESTISLYSYIITRLQNYLNDCPVESISQSMLRKYMIYLQTFDANPNANPDVNPRKDNKPGPVSGSTLQKHFLAIRLFFDWATITLQLTDRPDAHLKMSARNCEQTLPFEKVELDAVLKAITRTVLVKPSTGSQKRAAYSTERPTKARDLALILLLIDTGISVSRACSMKVSNFLPQDNKIQVTYTQWTDQVKKEEDLLSSSFRYNMPGNFPVPSKKRQCKRGSTALHWKRQQFFDL